jgi:hypothetical protein
MEKPIAKKTTFIIQINNYQNATWQGTITWTNGRMTEYFRSALEMIKLIDSAVTEEGEGTARDGIVDPDQRHV